MARSRRDWQYDRLRAELAVERRRRLASQGVVAVAPSTGETGGGQGGTPGGDTGGGVVTPPPPPPPLNQAPNKILLNWRAGILSAGKLPVATAIGTALFDLAASPGTNIAYSKASNADTIFSIVGSVGYLAATPTDPELTLSIRAANEVGAYIETFTIQTDVTVVAPAAAHGLLAGPQKLILGAYIVPPNEMQKWKDRGVNTIVGIGDGVDPEAHNTQASLLGLYQIRKPRADIAADLAQAGLLAFETDDEPSNITNGGGLDYPNVRQTPAQVAAQAAPWRSAAAAAGITVPIFTNMIGNHVWPSYGQSSPLIADYHQGAESDWVGADTYPVNAGYGNLLNQDGYVSTYQGHILDVQRGWTATKPLLSFLETGPIASGPQITPAEWRTQFWSSLIHGASMICLFPIRLSPTFSWDATPANVAAEITTQFAAAKAIEDILIDTTNGGRRAYTVLKCAPSGQSPGAGQLPYPFEGCEITKSDGSKYYIVLNLSTADAAFTYIPWGVQNVTIPAQSVKHGNVSAVTIPSNVPRGKIPIAEDATLIPGIQPNVNLKSPIGVSGITIVNTWTCFVADGTYVGIDFDGYRIVRTGSGKVWLINCKITQHPRWNNLTAIIMDWDQEATVQPALRAPVNDWTYIHNCKFDGGWTTDSTTNIPLFVCLKKGPVDVWMNDIEDVNEQFISLHGGRIQQNRGLRIGWLPGGHTECISITNSWAGWVSEISENYCDDYCAFINDGAGGASGWLKHYNELDGLIQGELICENNWIFSSGTNPKRMPWYTLSVGTIDHANGGRAWFGFNKFSGYNHEDNAGATPPYPYSSNVSIVQGMCLQGNVNQMRSNRALPDQNLPTVPAASTVTFTSNTSNFQVASIALGANATEVELRYCASLGPRWSAWKKISVGDTFPGNNGVYDVEYRSVRRVGTQCARQVGKTATTVTVGSVTPQAPGFVSGPTLGGPASPTVGSTFSIAYTGSGNPGPSPSYRWLRDGTTPISGATSSTYTAVSADTTHTVVGEVMLNNGVSPPAVATTAASAVIAAGGGGSLGIRATGTADTEYEAFGRDDEITFAVPATRVSGDLLIGWIYSGSYDNANPHVPNTGWTLSRKAGTFGQVALAVTKTSDGSETSYTYHWDLGIDDANLIGRCTVVQSAVNGFEGWNSRGDWAPSASTIAGVSVTQSGNSIVFQQFTWDGTATIASDPAGWTKLFETNAANSGGDPTRKGNMAVYYKNQTTSGVVTAPTLTLTGAPSTSCNVIGVAIS